MNNLKRKFPYVLGMAISVISLLAMIFAVIVIKNSNIKYSFYDMCYLTNLGFWHVLLSIFLVVYFMLLIFVFFLCLLEILNEYNVVKFEVTVGKITSYLLLKIALITMFILTAIMLFLSWFMILANKQYGIVFGAGPFINLAVLLIGTVLFIFLERADYFKNWENLPKTNKHPQIIIENENANNTKEDEIVVEEKNNEKKD